MDGDVDDGAALLPPPGAALRGFSAGAMLDEEGLDFWGASDALERLEAALPRHEQPMVTAGGGGGGGGSGGGGVVMDLTTDDGMIEAIRRRGPGYVAAVQWHPEMLSDQVDPAFQWGEDAAPQTALTDTVIYEAHVKGLTALHPGVPAPLRGTVLGLCADPVLEHLVRLGVTAVELLPVQAFVDDRFLVSRGLRNYWGYQTIGFFAPEPRYLGRGGIREMQSMVHRFHSAGIEVILDVVYNHSGEGDALGPTLSFRGLDNRSYYRLADGGRNYVNDTGTGNTFNLTHPMVLRMVMDSLRYWVETYHVDGSVLIWPAFWAARPADLTRRAAFLTQSARTRCWPASS